MKANSHNDSTEANDQSVWIILELVSSGQLATLLFRHKVFSNVEIPASVVVIYDLFNTGQRYIKM